MSALITLTQEASSLLLSGPPLPIQDSITDTVNAMNKNALTTVRAVSVTVAVVFIVVTIIATKMAMGRVLIAGLSAALGLWLIFNVTDVKDRVGNEVDASTSTSTTTLPPALAYPVLEL